MRCAWLVVCCLLALPGAAPVRAQLPQACASGCNAGVWVSQDPGRAPPAPVGRTLTVKQIAPRETFHWQSFDIDPGYRVHFDQPSASAIALNRIFDADPSRINGALTATGQVYLINRNGIVFGAESRVNVATLIASSLDITPEAVEQGIARAIGAEQPAFSAFLDADGNVVSGEVRIERGARLRAAGGGAVLVFAPVIRNDGSIETPDGQAVLAAGEKVYLMSSRDQDLRGLLVEVDAQRIEDADLERLLAGETRSLASAAVTNRGSVSAPRGNVTLMGLAVNQEGRVSATTAVRSAGSVRLLARDRVSTRAITFSERNVDGTAVLENTGIATPSRAGLVRLGAGSFTEVRPEVDDPTMEVDVNRQPVGEVLATGRSVRLEGGSRVQAPGAEVVLRAQGDPSRREEKTVAAPEQRVRVLVESGAAIDVAGTEVTLPADRNALEVRLLSGQLADRAVQRDGPLRGETVTVDVRRRGTLDDGTPWVGTPLADLSGDLQALGRTVAERTVGGGQVAIQSDGEVLVEGGASIDLSGGAVQFRDGIVATSRLVFEGRVFDISEADPDQPFDAVLGPFERRFERWGVVDSFDRFPGGGEFSSGHIQGADAGTLSVRSPRLVLDGEVLGATRNGRFQRQPAQELAAGATRPFDQVARGARLVLGDPSPLATELEFVTGNVTLEPGTPLPGLAATGFSPRFDPLPQALQDTVRLAPSLFGADRLQELDIFANGLVSLPAGVSLALPAGGALSVTAPAVSLQGRIRAPGARVEIDVAFVDADFDLRGGDRSFVLGPGAGIDLSGVWVNDLASLPAAPPPAPLHLDGGALSVRTEVAREVILAAGAAVDVSGGAWLDAGGVLHAGVGGVVELQVLPDKELPGGARLFAETPLTLASSLRGFGLDEGGRLSIAVPAVCIGAAGCAGGGAGRLVLPAAHFSRGGFAEHAIASNVGGLVLAAGTVLRPTADNLVLAPGFERAASGADLDALARAQRLPDSIRRPVDLSLEVSAANAAGTFGADGFDAAGILSVEPGAAILAEPGATVELVSNTRLQVDGTIDAPAGEVTLALDASLELDRFFPAAQTIWLGSGARIGARSVPRLLAPDVLGLRGGEVLDGGTISLLAERGFVVAEAGSVLDVSGAAATLDLPVALDPLLGIVSHAPRPVAGSAGSIRVRAAEGFLLEGDLRAAPAAVAGAAGGRLDLVLDPSGRRQGDASDALGFPDRPRVVSVHARHAPAVVSALAPGEPVPVSVTPAGGGDEVVLHGAGLLGTDAVAGGRFDDVRIAARDLFPASGAVAGGRIDLVGDLSLAARARLLLDAPELRSGGGESSLEAAFVRLGSGDEQSARVPPATPGAGSLEVDAQLIEVLGTLALGGFEQVRLDSRGDIRLRGVAELEAGADEARTLDGVLTTAADLTLRADQIYPTTLSDFRLEVTDGAGLALLPGGVPGAVLSAGGRLTLAAEELRQAGTLRAPFGTLRLQGQRIELAPGSVTSTSGAGLLVPFGSLQGGFDLTFPVTPFMTLVFDGVSATLPQQRIEIDAAQVSIEAGATVDLRGGGDLFASEFVPGVGGTRDPAANDRAPERFAILPGLAPGFAPHDEQLFRGFDLDPGQSITLGAAPGLPAGTHALLPARYGLLPGAWLVERVSGVRDLAPGQALRQLDGAVVVPGRRGLAGTEVLETRSSGYRVTPGSRLLREGRFDTARASAFFAGDRAAAARTPADAGVLSLAVDSSLVLAGGLRAAGLEGARGAGVDIAAAAIRVVEGTGGDAVPGLLRLDAARLEALAAESLLLGGLRREAGSTVELDVRSASVALDPGVALAGEEVILAARDSVELGAGSRLAASGRGAGAAAARQRLQVTGEGAVVRVSSGAQARIERSGEAPVPSRGVVTVDPGAVLSASGSITTDASLDTVLLGEVAPGGGSLDLGASRIVLGDAPGGTPGLVLRGEELAALDAAELVLSSRSSVDLFPGSALFAERLVIDAAGIAGFGDAGDEAVLGARELVLANTAGLPFGAAPGGDGQLLLAAERLILGDTAASESQADATRGRFTIDGFAHVELIADGSVQGVAAGAGPLRLAHRPVDGVARAVRAEGDAVVHVTGDASVRAVRIGAASGARLDLRADGTLALGVSPLPAGAAEPAAAVPDELAGRLAFAGRALSLDTRLEAPAGHVSLQATGAAGDLVLEDGAVIDVAARAAVFDGVAVTPSAGSVHLAAAGGDVVLRPGSRLDLSPVPAGDGGRLEVDARAGSAIFEGTVAAGTEGARAGGAFALDAAQLADAGALAERLAGAGFRRALDLEVGTDLLLEGVALAASELRLVSAGDLVLRDTTLDASGRAGGRIELWAGGDLQVIGSVLDAAAHGAGEDGGRVLAGARDGTLALDAGSRVRLDAGDGAAEGRLELRAPASGDAVSVQALAADLTPGAQTVLEGVLRFTRSALGAADVAANDANPIFAGAAALMAGAGALGSALGQSANPDFRLRPGIEIASPGDLTLSADWNLDGWRFAGEPGVLTLRAGGDLRLDASLSDGFSGGAGSATLLDDASWSYRLVAGAGAASPDPLAVAAPGSLASGSVVLAPGTVSAPPAFPSPFVPPRPPVHTAVRTGTGDIQIAAALDVSLGNRASVIYTAGRSNDAGAVPLDALGGLGYAAGGGDVRIEAGRDVLGAETIQLVTDWLWRAGTEPQAAQPSVVRESATGWTVRHDWFEQNVGALGGGDVTVRAGRDIRNLSAVVPTTGRQIGGQTPAQSVVEITGGGDLAVRAGRDIASGIFFVDGGGGRIAAGGSLVAGRSDPSGQPVHTILALGDARVEVQAAGALDLEAVINPTILAQARAHDRGGLLSPVGGTFSPSFFFTFAADSAVELRALAGDVVLHNDAAAIAGSLEGGGFPLPGLARTGNGAALLTAAPTLRAAALSGDVLVQRAFPLLPSPQGNLELLAARDVVLDDAAVILLSDFDPARLPGPAQPAVGFSSSIARALTPSGTPPADASLRAGVPVHRGDPTVARIVARDGDVRMLTGNANPLLNLSKPVRVVAGRDVTDLRLLVQHPDGDDVTEIAAGRDVLFSVTRNAFGGIQQSARGIVVDGSGRLDVLAGRDVDLAASRGVVTRGDTVNPALPDAGADILVAAGLGPAGADFERFIDTVIAGEASHESALAGYLGQLAGTRPEQPSGALAALRALPREEQRPFLLRVLFEELRASGRAAAETGGGDFSRGFAAIDALFPGDDFDGDLRLFFSRLSTLDGGDVALLAPGGLINAGLATPPAAFGISKPPSELGIIAQAEGSIRAFVRDDFEVNESRVFAAREGDILIWSSRGDIDAGRGSKSAISSPPPVITPNDDGTVSVEFPPTLTGSGIRTFLSEEPVAAPRLAECATARCALSALFGPPSASVDLFAPGGVVDAGEAGIGGVNVTIGATEVLNAESIDVGGVSVGVPATESVSIAAGLTGASNAAAGASNAAQDDVARATGDAASQDGQPFGEQPGLGFISVEVLGFGG